MFSNIDQCRICNSNSFSEVFFISDMPITAEPISKNGNVKVSNLTVLKCNKCSYVFLKEVITAEFYKSYLYTPQISSDIKKYLNLFVNKISKKLKINKVNGIEIGSGDGSLCNEFNKANFDFTGVEPSKPLCKLSNKQNVKTINGFWNKETVEANFSKNKTDIIVVRHVLEHIDSFTEFFEGINYTLVDDGYLIVEVPYLGNIVKDKQFYSFFFEHLSYFSLDSLNMLFSKFGLNIFDYEFVSPEGGSILVYAKKQKNHIYKKIEEKNFYNNLDKMKLYYQEFKSKFINICKTKNVVSAYGAGQRGITLLNLINADNKLIEAIYDENSNYYGLVTPKSNIEIRSPERLNPNATCFIFATSYENQIKEKYKNKVKEFISINEIL